LILYQGFRRFSLRLNGGRAGMPALQFSAALMSDDL
jgi:hypothetical protein